MSIGSGHHVLREGRGWSLRGRGWSLERGGGSEGRVFNGVRVSGSP